MPALGDDPRSRRPAWRVSAGLEPFTRRPRAGWPARGTVAKRRAPRPLRSEFPRIPPVPYRFVPHTADIAVELLARDEAGLRASGVDALRALLVGSSAVEAREERPVDVGRAAWEHSAAAERLVRFLAEVLYLYAERFVPARAGGAGVLGEPFDPARHTAAREVKAVTYHGATVHEDARGLSVTLVFDV
jgi:SHS2 domain-containing protein